MYIKKVIIQGFKSFREEIDIDDFDPGHNVIIGLNGSGKSNFFQAIQFVLSDEFSHLRSNNRQGLIHEGAGSQLVLSGYVEIIFDNSDGRLPIGQKEVYLRRLIGLKNNQYILNKKLATITDVMNLLESAGLSRSNPYYIVKQGEINKLALAPDSERLALLREIAGTRVYDERRVESKLILKDTNDMLEKIVYYLTIIEARLEILGEEKQELKEYQLLDKQRRSLEYTIYDRELKGKKREFNELLKLHANSGAGQAKLGSQLKQAQEIIHTNNQQIKEIKKELKISKTLRDTLSVEQQHLLEDKSKLTLLIEDLMDELKGETDSGKKTQQELDKIKEIITEKEQELASITAEYDVVKYCEEECRKMLNSKEQKRKELYAKEGRGNQFANKFERDEWIGNELKKIVQQIQDKENYKNKINQDLKADMEKQKQLEQLIVKKTKEMNELKQSIDENSKKHCEMSKKKNQHQAVLKEQYRKESELQIDLSILKEDLLRAENSLRSMVGKGILNGRESIKKVIETFRQHPEMRNQVNSYFGQLIDNLNCDKSIYTAVEVTAGNRLFYHIVETDAFGTKILKEMNKQSLPGELTFMPLNRLYAKSTVYPQNNDAIPIISKIQYDPKYDTAMRYIFGKTLLCRNLETATELARTTGLDCVTLEGDQVSSKGCLTGGFFNKLKSRLEFQRTSSDTAARIDSLGEELELLSAAIDKTNEVINSCMSNVQKAEIKHSKAKDKYDSLKAEIGMLKENLKITRDAIASKEASLAEYTSSLETMMATRESFESEMKQDFTTQLSTADQCQINSLNGEIEILKGKDKESFNKLMRLEAEKNKLENLLTNNLRRRRDELVQALQEISGIDRQFKLDVSNSALSEIEKRLNKVNNDLKLQNNKITAASKKQEILLDDIKKWEKKEKEIQEIITSDAQELEKFSIRENMLQEKIADCTKKITELGTIPGTEISNKLVNLSIKQLMKEIENINEKLKKYGDVNKMALDQFLMLSEQKETFVERKAELDRGEEKIVQLMNTLELRKYEAIQFTFKQVSMYFSETFKKLVPSGHGELVMLTNAHDDDDAEEVDDSVPHIAQNFDKFTGIGIHVSFTGRKAEMRDMIHLSGGQKSLVALALIFAIQKCDPAPFYLFDEIDQALDPQHRKAVAHMIHELSSKAQFITTTFRPEMLEHADKYYGVLFRNQVSHVQTVTREQAADFVEDDTTRE